MNHENALTGRRRWLTVVAIPSRTTDYNLKKKVLTSEHINIKMLFKYNNTVYSKESLLGST